MPEFSNTPPTTLYFGDFELRHQPLMLLKAGKPVALPAQPLRLLQLLVTNAGHIVTHRNIQDHLWHDQIVDYSGSVHVCIRQIRAALGDTASDPVLIENIPRRGYRFLQPACQQLEHAGRGKNAAPLTVERSYEQKGLKLVYAGFTVMAVLWLAWISVFQEWTASELSSEALDSYRRGKYLLESSESNNLARSREFFHEAITLDPQFAPAYAALADSYQREFNLNSAREFANQALDLDPGLAEAHLRVAAVLSMGDWQWGEAETHIRKALAIDPKLPEAYHALASVYAVTGRLSDSIDLMQRALELDPASTLLRADFGSFLYYLGRYDEALTQCSAALRLQETNSSALICLFDIAVQRNDLEGAVELAGQVMQLRSADDQLIHEVTSQPTLEGIVVFQNWRIQLHNDADSSRLSPATFALAHAAAGNHEAALVLLEHAVNQRQPLTPFVVLDPAFSSLHENGRFLKLLATMNIGLS